MRKHGALSDRIGPRFVDSVAIGACSVIASILLIANPGYFNHDELQTIDYISRFGLLTYFRNFAGIHSGANLGIPMRPVSFLIEGLFALPMYRAPVLTHLFDVLLHTAVVLLLYFVLRSAAASRGTSLLAAILFSCSPLATFAAGWAGALMDPIYVFFALWTIFLTARFFQSVPDWRILAGISLTSALAMLSKETALVLPLAVAVLIWQHAARLDAKRAPRALFAPIAASAIPVAAYCVVRMPAILASLSGEESGHYRVSMQNIGSNLITYMAYPFVPTLTEPVNVVFVATSTLAAALCLHALLILLIGRFAGARAALLYLILFVLPLGPVLTITGKGGQYLYASGLVISLGVAIAIRSAWIARRRLAFAASLFLSSILLLHTAINQASIYSIGRCMDRAMTSLESQYLAAGRPPRVAVRIDPGAPGHVISRIITGRNQIGPYYPVEMEMPGKDDALREDALNVRFSPGCLVY